MSKRTKKVIGLILFCAIGLALFARIAYVNLTWEYIPSVEVPQGESAKLGDNFITYKDDEHSSKDYELTVLSARKTSYSGFLQSLGKSAPTEFSSSNDSILDVELKIENTGDIQGGLEIFDLNVVSEDNSRYYIVDCIGDESLFYQAYGIDGMSVSIKPHTSFVLHLPYVTNGNAPEIYQEHINGNSFKLVATRQPQKIMFKMIVE